MDDPSKTLKGWVTFAGCVLVIVVLYWELADESTQVLRDTGANLVASTLLETRTYLGGLVEIPRIPGTGGVPAP